MPSAAERCTALFQQVLDATPGASRHEGGALLQAGPRVGMTRPEGARAASAGPGMWPGPAVRTSCLARAHRADPGTPVAPVLGRPQIERVCILAGEPDAVPAVEGDRGEVAPAADGGRRAGAAQLR